MNVIHRFIVYLVGCRWGIAYEVPEDMIDLLALNSISVIRIPPGKCLSFEFFPFFILALYSLIEMFSLMAWVLAKRTIRIHILI